jgi:hypothetical protein
MYKKLKTHKSKINSFACKTNYIHLICWQYFYLILIYK